MVGWERAVGREPLGEPLGESDEVMEEWNILMFGFRLKVLYLPSNAGGSGGGGAGGSGD